MLCWIVNSTHNRIPTSIRAVLKKNHQNIHPPTHRVSCCLCSTTESFVRSIIAQRLDQLNPFALGHQARTVAQAMLEGLDELANDDALVGNLVQNF